MLALLVPCAAAADPPSDTAQTEPAESTKKEETKPAKAEPKRPSDDPFDTSNLETPIFPDYTEYDIGDAVRIRLQSRFLPAAHFDGFDADLYQPSLRVQLTAPISKRGAIQLSGRFSSSLYEVDGTSDFLGNGVPTTFPFDEFYDGSIALQGAYALNEGNGLFVEREQWSVLANGFVRSRWESGAFSEGFTGGGSVGIGYEIDNLIRVALGVSVQSRLDRSGVAFDPVLSLRWDVTRDVTLRNRGTGLQLEYRVVRDLELFVAGFVESDRVRLDPIAGLPNDLSFRDRATQVGVGAEWKVHDTIRLNLEVGAVVERSLRVQSEELGTLWKEKGAPSAYLEFRIQIRP